MATEHSTASQYSFGPHKDTALFKSGGNFIWDTPSALAAQQHFRSQLSAGKYVVLLNVPDHVSGRDFITACLTRRQLPRCREFDVLEHSKSDKLTSKDNPEQLEAPAHEDPKAPPPVPPVPPPPPPPPPANEDENEDEEHDNLRLDNLIQGGFEPGEYFIVVWALQSEAVDLLALHDFIDAEPPQRLSETSPRVVVVVNEENMGFAPADLQVRSRKRGLEAELERLRQFSEEDRRNRVKTAMLSHFDDTNAARVFFHKALKREVLANLPNERVSKNEYIDRSCSIIINQESMDDGFFREWQNTCPRHAREIADLRELCQLPPEDRRAQIESELELIKPRRGAPRFDPITVDIVECLLSAHQTSALHREFDAQRAKGRWGRDTTSVVAEVRKYVETGTFPEQVERRRGSQLEEGALADKSALDLLVLFVASHLDRLGPEDFDALVRGLIALERPFLPPPPEPASPPLEGKAAQARPHPPPPPCPLDMWSYAADTVLARNDLGVSELSFDGQVRLTVSWNFEPDRPAWEGLLTKRRHYFTHRQLRHLSTTEFLLFETRDSSDDVAYKIINLHVRTTRSVPTHPMRWVEVLLDDEAFAELVAKNHATLRNKMKQALLLIQSSGSGASATNVFLESAIHQGGACWVLPLVGGLARMTDFDALYWMGVIYSNARRVDRPAVRRAVVDLARAERGRQYEAWHAITTWLGPKQGWRREGIYRLGFEAALEVLERSVLVTRQTRLYWFDDWLERGGPAPAPLRWLLHPKLLTHCVASEGNAANLGAKAIQRILRGVSPAESAQTPGVELTHHEIFTDFWSELADLATLELLPGLERDARRYLCFCAAVLLSWQLRLASDAPSLTRDLEWPGNTPMNEPLSLVLFALSQAVVRAHSLIPVDTRTRQHNVEHRRLQAAISTLQQGLLTHAEASS